MFGPKVSFIVPVYNSELYIARCLDSILGQSYSNIEIVCVDDGSKDGSAAILDGYSASHPDKVKVIHQENAGAAASRNRAILVADGEYISFVDNDDWLDADFTQTLVSVALESGAEVVCSGYRRPDDKGNVIFSAVPKQSDEWGPYLVEAAWAKLYSSAFVRRNELLFLDTNIDEDLYFSLPAVELAKKVIVVPYCGYNWFFNTKSVSNTSQRSSNGLRFEETLDAILAMLADKGIEISPLLEHYFVRLITWFLLYTRKGDGLEMSLKNLDHYVDWLDNKLPNWRNDSFATPSRPVGDAFKNRLAVWLFVRHPQLFSWALRIYGKVA